MDLDIELDRTSSVALPHQIGRSIMEMICDGTIPKGTRLPASRVLAPRLGVARLTVVEAYQWLADQGYVASRRGARAVVQDVQPLPADAVRPRPSSRLPDASAGRDAEPDIDFRAGRPDLTSFPRKRWLSALGAASRALPASALDYGDPLGHPPLREAIRRYLHRSRGLDVDLRHIAITTGSAQAVDMVLRALPDRREIVLEHPGHVIISRLIDIHDVSVRSVPVDGEGIRTDLLPDDTSVRRIALVTPSHQFPTGCRMSLARRVELIAWAARTDAIVVEDDYDSEFAYDGRPAVPLAKLDRTGRVIYVGTFSKTMVPALRLGFMVVPPHLVDRIAALKLWVDFGGSVPEQAALARWIDDGTFERHVQQMRGVYRCRYELLLREMTARLGDRVRVIAAPVGMHVLAFVRIAGPAAAVAARARGEGVQVYPLDGASALEQPGEAAFVFGFGNVPEADISRGIAVFAAAVLGPSRLVN